MASIVVFDLETFSTVDLKTYGVYRYANCPNADVICGAFAPVYSSTEYLIHGFKYNNPEYKNVLESIEDCKTLIAHNIEFDLEMYNQILVKKYAFPPVNNKSYICTRKRQAFLRLPESLKDAANFFNLNQRKDETGIDLIKYLSLPNKNGQRQYNPELEQKMYDYCMQDIRTTIELFYAQNELLSTLGVTQPQQWDLKVQQLDTKINKTGVPVNVELAKEISSLAKENIALAQLEAIKHCDNDWEMPLLSQTAKLKEYIKEKYKVEIDSFSNNYDRYPEEVRELIKIRDKATQTSLAKADVILDHHVNGRLYGQFKYYGAHTGRFSGKDFQIQNLPKNGDESDPQSFLRNIIAAEKENTLIFVDYASIEHRLLFYIATKYLEYSNLSCPSTLAHLKKIQKNEETYSEFAAEIYGIDQSLITKKSPERQLGKIGHLSLGYMMGAPAFYKLCVDQKIDIDKETAGNVVKMYRNKYRGVSGLWYFFQNLFFSLAEATETTHVKLFLGMSATLTMAEDFSRPIKNVSNILTLVLPSGRPLFYLNFRKVASSWPDGSPNLSIGYDSGLIEVNLKSDKKAKFTKTLHGGTIVENIVQAVSRDILTDHMLKIESKIENAKLIAHVHDEILIETSKDSVNKNLEIINQIMRSPPDWLPNVPLEIETTINEFYRK